MGKVSKRKQKKQERERGRGGRNEETDACMLLALECKTVTYTHMHRFNSPLTKNNFKKRKKKCPNVEIYCKFAVVYIIFCCCVRFLVCLLYDQRKRCWSILWPNRHRQQKATFYLYNHSSVQHMLFRSLALASLSEPKENLVVFFSIHIALYFELHKSFIWIYVISFNFASRISKWSSIDCQNTQHKPLRCNESKMKMSRRRGKTK